MSGLGTEQSRDMPPPSSCSMMYQAVRAIRSALLAIRVRGTPCSHSTRFEVERAKMSKALNCMAASLLLVSALALTSQSSATAATTSCSVVGTWELTGITVDGKAIASRGQQRKIVTADHFMWINQATRRDTLPLKTRADSLVYSSVGGGSGTYRLQGNSYVEHIDYFNDPAYLGKDWKATCRTDKNHWVHSYTLPGAAGAAPQAVVENWRRVA